MIIVVSCYLDTRLSFRSSNWGSRTEFNDCLIKKYPDVSASRSFKFDDRGEMGLEFSNWSAWVISVRNSLKVKLEIPAVLRQNFSNLMLAFYKPPKFRDQGGIKCQEIWSNDK